MPEHRPVVGTAPGDKPRRFYFICNEQWSGLNPFQDFNWRDFTFVRLDAEHASYSGRFELNIGLLGVSCCVTYIYDQSFNREMLSLKEQIMDEIKDRTGCEVVDPTRALDGLRENE